MSVDDHSHITITGTGTLHFIPGSEKKKGTFEATEPHHLLKGDYTETDRDTFTGHIEFQLKGTITHNHGIGSQKGKQEEFSVKAVRVKNSKTCKVPTIKDLDGGRMTFKVDPDAPNNNAVDFDFLFMKHAVPPHVLAAFCTFR